ncbi:hypothetical protein BCV70DRAFT_158783 [Testicularia cyperi]|uniref:SEC7 domain-containing protein n=1 Tax=Testicularia cyperi TaxID=1882483 RepID=A0A317XT89_9BASI|nr:hypothetical protein BCV70DRAFT_158783 [Testicularia cyperi]
MASLQAHRSSTKPTLDRPASPFDTSPSAPHPHPPHIESSSPHRIPAYPTNGLITQSESTQNESDILSSDSTHSITNQHQHQQHSTLKSLPASPSRQKRLEKQFPLKDQIRRPFRKTDVNYPAASAAAANSGLSARPPFPASSAHSLPSKSSKPNHIGRSFEALLASDETYVFKETADVARGPDELEREQLVSPSDTNEPLSSSTSDGARRVLVDRRPRRSSSSLRRKEPYKFGEDIEHLTLTPDSHLLADPASTVLTNSTEAHPVSSGPSASSKLRHKGIQDRLRNEIRQAPSSPDRTTSLLHRHSPLGNTSTSTTPPTNTAMSAMPGFLIPPSQDRVAPLPSRTRNRAVSSVGLEEEVELNPEVAEGSASTTSFRQRMKKTSGFLRKLRGGDSGGNERVPKLPPPSKAASVIPSGRSYANSASNASTTSLSHRTGTSVSSATTLGRKESRGSVYSGEPSSRDMPATPNSSSISPLSTPVRQTIQFVSTQDLAVPCIPERFMTIRHLGPGPSVATARRQSEADVSAHNATPTRRGSAAARIPSAPSDTLDRDGQCQITLPQRSSSQSYDRHHLSSTESSGALRIAIRNFESEMDDALKDPPRADLEPQPSCKPDRNFQHAWGPSPQLPDLDIQRYKERSGSFLEEPEFNATTTGHTTIGSEISVATPVVATHPDSTESSISPTSQDSTYRALPAYPRSLPEEAVLAEVPFSGHINPSSPSVQRLARPISLVAQEAPTDRAESPIESMASAHNSQRNSCDSLPLQASSEKQLQRRTANSGASLTSFKSFETAAESTGVNSADAKITTFPRSSRDSTEAGWSIDGEAAPTKGACGEREADSLAHFSPLQSKSDSAVLGVASSPKSLRDQRADAGLMPESENEIAKEQSIRLVTKPSDPSTLQEYDDGADSASTELASDTVLVHSCTSPMQTSLPKVEELPATSAVRPDRGRPLFLDIRPAPHVGRSSSSLGVTSLARAASLMSSPLHSPMPNQMSFDMSPSIGSHDSFDAAGSQPYAATADELADKCWAEDPSFLKKEKIAEWLGGLGLVNRAARARYFANFDFNGLRVDMAFRKLCEKLFLRAETQQVDRILAAFSQRYFECNSDSVFGSSDVVHSVVFSILLLNTDLHIAELQERMTRQQFVRNTMGAIEESGADVPAFDDGRSSFSVQIGETAFPMSRSRDAAPLRAPISADSGLNGGVSSGSTPIAEQASVEHEPMPRPSIAPDGTKSRESEIEAMLKDIYTAVKSERILLPAPEGSSGRAPATARPSGALSPILSGRRKTGTGSDRVTALKRGSIRGIQGLLGGLNGNSGSGNSLDAGLLTSPNPVRSSIDSWGRSTGLLAPVSERSNSTLLAPPPPVTPGFASTLNQTTIRESQEGNTYAAAAAWAKALQASKMDKKLDDDDEDDDELALAGPPWAKEGTLIRKHYWESPGKRAKDKNWTEVFVVVSKGQLSMFRFDTSSSTSTYSKAKGANTDAATGAIAGGIGAIGGGNWLSSATCLGEVQLAHCLANALPPPGYNRQRPHVFALTLPGGRVYFFQTGHEELVHEWVSTCNYWAARQSKEPLPGGVSNMEYGWNKVLPQMDDFEEIDGGSSMTAIYQNFTEATSALVSPTASSTNLTAGQLHASGTARKSFSSPAPSFVSSSVGVVTSNERVFINEWRVPSLPTMASQLSEEPQLIRLERHVKLIESDLVVHNELRTPMLSLYSPRGRNHAKALSNWERKSNHLLQELVKYQSYIEALKRSVDLKAEKKAKKELEGMIEEADAAMAEVQI